ncbi:MarR family transcriptional regulator [Rhodobacteraceae bacterium N5(2021)]|uniref:MarR family transcriptional regulator n=1 Tax=Gymnodinialimonas phycosphaerae TaxID=2841589 RepID=A0A975TTY9_9RHOB|nr:MarR family transcriptional regulator [Gymnodinialimonas phycosphaerae]MBY4894501.1 MarR family transcriptional regulator [Gymnodinialimonas phycosphaerae]
MQDAELALLIDRFMRRIHFGLQSKGPSFDTEKVGPGGGIVLLTLSDMGCPSLHELTKQVARDKSQMTRTIRSLETKGLVSRKPSPDDARVTLVYLTQAGERVVDALQRVVSETINEILSPISKSEEQVLRDLLERALGTMTTN